MTVLELTRETWLDLVVNIIPIGILAFFDLLFVVVNPWGWDLLTIVLMHFLTLFPLAVLAVVTWVSGAAIQGAEGEPTE
ncbi:DUF6684 family protein [Halobacteriales archaeon Cl-PHB]